MVASLSVPLTMLLMVKLGLAGEVEIAVHGRTLRIQPWLRKGSFSEILGTRSAVGAELLKSSSVAKFLAGSFATSNVLHALTGFGWAPHGMAQLDQWIPHAEQLVSFIGGLAALVFVKGERKA